MARQRQGEERVNASLKTMLGVVGARPRERDQGNDGQWPPAWEVTDGVNIT